LPKDFPPYSTVQGYFYAWVLDGRWELINHALVMASRERAGRQASPTAGVIHSQSVLPAAFSRISAGPDRRDPKRGRARHKSPLAARSGLHRRDSRRGKTVEYDEAFRRAMIW
jgi:transposase